MFDLGNAKRKANNGEKYCRGESNMRWSHAFFVSISIYIGKEVIPFHKISGLYSLLVKVKTNMTEKLYHNERSCDEILFFISSVVQKKC